MKLMKAPKILPWVARKAGITDAQALKLWRRAASEAETLSGKRDGAEFSGLAVECFLALVEDETGQIPQHSLTPAPRLTWMWQHQTRLSMLSLLAAQNAYRYWQHTWGNLGPQGRVA